MRPLAPMAVLVAAVAASSVFFIAHVAAGPPPSETVQALTSLALVLSFVLWVMADARSRRRIPCYDFGFLVAVFFPASLVWYVLWSRGWRGLLTLAALIGLMLLPSVCGTVAWIIRHGAG
jgi:hypothetical protein